MAHVAVNKDGTEVIGNDLHRAYYNKFHWLEVLDIESFTGYKTSEKEKENAEIWVDPYFDRDEDQFEDTITELPKGTIKKLIGRDLTWEDEPVELK